MNTAFDLDGVLIDILPVLRRELLRITNIDIGELKDLRHYGFERYGVTEKQKDQALERSYPQYRDHSRIDGATEVIHNQPYPIQVVTARSSKFLISTFGALEYHFPDVPFEVAFTNGHNNKLEIVKDFDFFVEDRGETALHLAEHGLKVFLLDKPYNQGFEHPNIIPIDDLRELLYFTHKKHIRGVKATQIC